MQNDRLMGFLKGGEIMSIHDYISFNSNEDIRRSIFQFVQMAGGMTIRTRSSIWIR